MCGIAGIISPNHTIINNDVLKRMAESLAHRGPDGESYWISNENNAGFAHRRLSVIDTSPAAAQPMHYLDRYSIVYNGEIYNYIELKSDLQKLGYYFRTSSDTEVILAAFAHFKEDCVDHFDGMFSFTIWDEKEQLLFCARDRFGEKPFFYFYDEEKPAFYFASEMKALIAAGVEPLQNNGLLLQYLAFGYTTDPSDTSKTFDARIKKLPASHWLKYNFQLSTITIRKYWDLSLVVSPIPLNEALERFNELLTSSVKRRLRSDVSLGSSLSGGLDSSSIAAIIEELHVKENLKTFTAAFPGFVKDESAKAQFVAEKFRLTNFTVLPTAGDFLEEFEKLLYHQEEPFTSGSVYAQYKVFELAAKEHVTVLLDGQGADETIAGYDKYSHWYLRSIFPRFTAKELIRRQQKVLNNNNSICKDFVKAASAGLTVVKPVVRHLNDLLYFNTFQSGLEELLRYADRNSMAHGREVRLPFLSHELVSFVFSLPSKYKIFDGYTKWILRKVMADKLPAEIVWHKKKVGFEPPQKNWMEQPLVQGFIVESRKELVRQGILNKSVLDAKPVAHGAYDQDTAEWRWMVAGAFMAKKRGLNRNSTPFLKSNIL